MGKTGHFQSRFQQNAKLGFSGWRCWLIVFALNPGVVTGASAYSHALFCMRRTVRARSRWSRYPAVH